MSEIVGLVPAAGSGTRMYPFSKAVPKEIYPVLGKAVIEHCIENLKAGGIKNIYIVVGHQKGALMDYVGDGSFFGVKVAYIYQLKRKGIGHAVMQASNWIKTTFAVLLGDSFIEPKTEMKELIEIHKREKSSITMLLFEVEDPTGYGIVKLKESKNGWGEVEALIEKPNPEEAKIYKNDGKYYAICGAYIFEPIIFDYIKQTKPGIKDEIQITDAISLAKNNGEKVIGVILKGKYLDIGKWNTVLKIEKELFSENEVEKFIEERNKLMKNILEKERSEL